MTLGFLSGSKIFCKLLCVSWEVFVLHGYDWIHWVAKSCTTIAYRWLFRDSQLSLRTLWSAVIKSPNFSARGAAPPIRLLHGALVILVLLQISQFRSLEIEYKHCAYPNPHVSWMWALKILHEKNWRVSLWVQELCHPRDFLWILAATPGFQNLRDLSRQTTGGTVLSWSLFLFVFLVVLVGLATLLVIGFTANNGCPRSIINIWHRHWRGITFSSILSFSSLPFTWCCCRWWSRRAWGRCTMITLLSWRCHWCWRMRTGGRTRWQAKIHDRNEVLRVTLYSNTVLNEMWFLTIDPFVRISVLIAKLSER